MQPTFAKRHAGQSAFPLGLIAFFLLVGAGAVLILSCISLQKGPSAASAIFAFPIENR
jgi:hypothetical protein